MNSHTVRVFELKTHILTWSNKLRFAEAMCTAYGLVINGSEHKHQPDNLVASLLVKIGDIGPEKAKKEQNKIRKTKIRYYERKISCLYEQLKGVILVQEVLDQ